MAIGAIVRKYLVPISIVVVLYLYCMLWFYVAYEAKQAVFRQLQAIKDNNSHVTLSYDYVTSSGFPFSIHIIIKNAHLKSNDNGNDIVSDSIIITPNMLGNVVSVSNNGDIQYSTNNQGDKQISTQRFHCEANPMLTGVFDTSVFKGDISDMTSLANHLKEFTYHDEGCTIEDTTNKKMLSHSKNTDIALNLTKKREKMEFDSKFNMKEIENLDPDTASKGFGKSDFSGNIKLSVLVDTDKDGKQTYKGIDVAINTIDLSSPRLVLGITGTLSSPNNNLIPIGDVRIKIEHVKNLVDFLANTYHMNADKVGSLLQKASDKTDSADKADITIKSTNAGITIGPVPLMEAVSTFFSK